MTNEEAITVGNWWEPVLAVKVRRLPHAKGLPLPKRQTAEASGYDLYAAIDEPVIIDPGRWAVIPTGIAIEMPHWMEAQVRPRSGLASKQGAIAVFGTIDADYRGEIGVILFNLGPKPVKISRGDRVAQLVFAEVVRPTLLEVDELTRTERGEDGFGSTGVR